MASHGGPNLAGGGHSLLQFPQSTTGRSARNDPKALVVPADWVLQGQESRLFCRFGPIQDPETFRGCLRSFRRPAAAGSAATAAASRIFTRGLGAGLEAWPQAWLQRSSQSQAPEPSAMRSTQAPSPSAAIEATALAPAAALYGFGQSTGLRDYQKASRNGTGAARSSPRSSPPFLASDRPRLRSIWQGACSKTYQATMALMQAALNAMKQGIALA